MHLWQQFFDSFAPHYDEQIFTQNTAAEIEFIVEHINAPVGGALLDLGCGTGRHSVALAQRGYQVTGVDISSGMLALATQRAREAGAEVEFVQSDAVQFCRPNTFDSVICLCEGALCLLGADDDPLEHDLAILRNIHASLKPGGVAILNVLSALRVIRAASAESVQTGQFDPLTLTERSDALQLVPAGSLPAEPRERYYTAPELRRLAESAGLEIRGIYGGTAGAWGLRPITLDDYELMLIARKPG